MNNLLKHGRILVLSVLLTVFAVSVAGTPIYSATKQISDKNFLRVEKFLNTYYGSKKEPIESRSTSINKNKYGYSYSNIFSNDLKKSLTAYPIESGGFEKNYEMFVESAKFTGSNTLTLTGYFEGTIDNYDLRYTANKAKLVFKKSKDKKSFTQKLYLSKIDKVYEYEDGGWSVVDKDDVYPDAVAKLKAKFNTKYKFINRSR